MTLSERKDLEAFEDQSEKEASARCHDKKPEVGPTVDEKLVAWLYVLAGFFSYVNTS